MKRGCELIQLVLLIGVFTPQAYSQAAAAAGGAVIQTDADSTFLNVLFDNSGELNEENKKRLQEFISSKLQYGLARSRVGAEELQHTRRAIAWNNAVSILSFVFVHLAVLLGFGGALVEFAHAYKLRRRRKVPDDIEITVKMESIAVKTTSVGVVLLVASIAFYFLYLKFVFPIQSVPL